MERFRDALGEVGYQPVDSARYYQFARNVPFATGTRLLKIDLLAGLPETAEQKVKLKVDVRRIRSVERLHVHTTPEAVTLDQHLLPVTVRSGELEATVYIPHPFTYLLLKLFALRDQMNEIRKGLGRHHAFDIYAVMAMLTEAEWKEVHELRDRFSALEQVATARQLVGNLFSGRNAPGMIRLREHLGETGSTLSREHLERFTVLLREAFAIADVR
jgi:hypothetical protein